MTRDLLDETFANMFSNISYQKDYVFYAHIIAQCKIVLSKEVDIAGVSFNISKYILYINPDNFDKLSLLERMAVLKHEALHILYNHVARKESRDHMTFNIATDCAINQLIKRDHLIDNCIFPDTLEAQLKKTGYNIKIPYNLSSEQYYDLIPEEIANDQKGQGDRGSQNTQQEAFTGLWENNPLDNHNKWNESEGEEELKKIITKRMLDKSIEKSRGTVPMNLHEFLDIWDSKPQISWKKVLRNITSNKKAKKIRTFMKKSRRFSKRAEIRGYKKDRTWDLICILDVSGSMSDDEIEKGLLEIKEVCKITNSNIKIIQVDTEIQEITDFSSRDKRFARRASGGTKLLPALKYIKKKKIKVDGIVVISDMYIESLRYWAQEGLNVPYLFLGTDSVEPPDLDNLKRARFFKLQDA